MDERLRKHILRDIQRANSFYTEKIEPVLRKRHQIFEADEKYYKKRFPKLSRQSDFVSFDFWSFVQWAIPAVMTSFFGGDEAVVILGRKAEDVPKAEVMKHLIDWQVNTQNKGFVLLWDWFSDAFQYGIGAVKVWWKREEEWDGDRLEHVDGVTLMQFQADPWCQITGIAGPDMFGGYEVQYRIGRLTENRPVIEPVRVTDLRWSPEAKNLEEANFVAQRKIVTADYLRRQAAGGMYDPAAVERAIESEGENIVYTAFETELNDETDQAKSGGEEGARALLELYECFVKLDVNGDGLLEDVIITVVGDEVIRLDENPWGRTPIFAISPVRDPFKVLPERSFAEIVGEVQTIKTALMRQFLVNTANANNPRFFVNASGIDPADLQAGNQYIKVTAGNPGDAVVPFPQAPIATWTMNLFEYLEGALEQWTGRTRYNQGMDSSSLNKTATGISLLQQASEQRIDYIVRVFAETGVGQMMRFLVELNQRYIDQAQVIRLENEPYPVTPDDLDGEFDIDVNTEAGVGKRKQTIQNLQYYLSEIAPLGIQYGAVTPGEWAKAAAKLLSESGIRDPQSYVMDPEAVKQQFLAAVMQQMAAQAAQAQLTGGGANGPGGAEGTRGADGAAIGGGGAWAALGGGLGGAGGVL